MSASGPHTHNAQAASTQHQSPVALTGLAGLWADALAAYSTAIERFWKEIKSPVKGAAPLRFNAVETHLEQSDKEIGRVREYAKTAGPLVTTEAFVWLLNVSDAGEEARRRLEIADNIISEPNMIYLATSRLSRTYSEEVGVMQRSMKQTKAAAAAAEAKYALFISGYASQEFQLAGMPLADARKAYLEPGRIRGGIATEIYLSYLASVAREAGSEAPQAREMLERAKDMVLGEATAAPAVEKAAPLHPIQAMGVVVGPAIPLKTQELRSPLAVDLSLPQSKTVVFYDPMPLIDPKAASAFGHIAMTTTGINFTLLQRFQTIREVPIKRVASRDLAPLPVCQDGPLPVSLDAGATLATISDPALQAHARPWDPSGGPRPRVTLYGNACADIVRSEIPDAPQSGIDLMAEQEKMQKTGDEKLLSSAEVTKRSMRDHFVAAYDKMFLSKPPADVLEVIDLLDAAPSFLLTGLMAATRVRDTIIMPSLIQADPRVPHAITDREALVTALVRAAEAAVLMKKKIKAVYWKEPPVFGKAMPAPKVREVVLEHFDRVVLAAAVEETGVQIIRMTSKVLSMVSSRTN
jgi:hypothetical protein